MKTALLEWVEVIFSKGTQFTPLQIERKLDKLFKQFPDVQDQIDTINECTMNGWAGWKTWEQNRNKNYSKQKDEQTKSWLYQNPQSTPEEDKAWEEELKRLGLKPRDNS